MRRVVLVLVLGVAGCSGRPVADTMDYLWPVEPIKPGTPTHGGVDGLSPPGPPATVDPPAQTAPIPPPAGEVPVPAIPPPPLE